MDSFGNRLKLLRNEKYITQTELGKKLNVTYVAVSKWESNKRFPDKDMLVKLADIFEVSTDYLLCRTDIRTALVVEYKVDGNDIQLEVNAKEYPNGMTREEVLKVLDAYEKLKSAGFDMIPKEEK